MPLRHCQLMLTFSHSFRHTITPPAFTQSFHAAEPADIDDELSLMPPLIID
jgi:hypothetical protein